MGSNIMLHFQGVFTKVETTKNCLSAILMTTVENYLRK